MKLSENLYGKVFEAVHFVHLVHLFSRIWMKLYESQFIWPSFWVCSLCSLVLQDLNEALWISNHLSKYLSLFTLFTCSFVLKDLNEALWISIYLTNYLSFFTLFTLFTCSQGFEWSFLKLNSFDQVFEPVHFVHLVYLFSRFE